MNLHKVIKLYILNKIGIELKALKKVLKKIHI